MRNTLPSIGLIHVTSCSCSDGHSILSYRDGGLFAYISASNIIFTCLLMQKKTRRNYNENQRTQSKNDSNKALKHAVYYQRCSALSERSNFASSKAASRRASRNDSSCRPFQPSSRFVEASNDQLLIFSLLLQ